jgi:hypothetical protein
MRVYRPQSTRQIPAGAKVDQVRKTVTYKGRDGRPVRAVLTDTGKMRVTQSVWRIAFKDALDRQQDIAAFTHEGQTRLLAGRIQMLIGLCGEPMPSDLKAYVDRLIPRIRTALQECDLLGKEQTPIGKPLPELVGLYEQALHARGRNDAHILATTKMLIETFTACRFGRWHDIRDDRLEAFLCDLREGPDD